MYHHQQSDGYGNGDLPASSGFSGGSGGGDSSNAFGWGEPSAPDETAQSEDEEDTSSTTSSEQQPCNECLQTQCVCNGFDPALLQQLQLPQLALLVHQQQQQQDSTDSTSSSTPTSPKPEPPFICQVCQEWFVVHDKLVLHLVVNHSMVYCKFCTRLFASQADHTVCVAHRGSLPCSVCGVPFRTDSSTTRHELAQHQARVHDVQTCPLCGTTSSSREALVRHLSKKHLCSNNMNTGNWQTHGIIMEAVDTWCFLCNLCEKQHPKTELFGHFHSHHRLNLACLIELLHCGRVFVPISGYQGNFSSAATSSSSTSYSACSSSSGTAAVPQSCSVCFQTFSVQVPKVAHDVFCANMAYCQYCALSFTSVLARELHVVRTHTSLPCIACGQSFPTETSLAAHHSRAHGSVMCCCCDTLVPPTTLENHLTTSHFCRLPTNMTTLCQLGNSLVACNLCLTTDKFTSSADDLTGIFTHLIQNHFMAFNKALSLLCRPSVHGNLELTDKVKEEDSVNQVSSDWANASQAENEDEAGESILVPQVDMHDASSESSAGSSDEGQEEDKQDPDVDPEDVECVTDSSDDELVREETEYECDLCDEKVCSARQLCSHFTTAHKMHWDRKGRTDAASADESRYQCDRCVHFTSKRTEMLRHKNEEHGNDIALGGKCRFCSQRFIQAAARDQHQLQNHADQQHSFYRCHICQVLVSSTVVLFRHELVSHPVEALRCTGLRLKCRVCLLLFPGFPELRAHFRAAHPAAMIFPCRHCGAHLKTRKTLRHHVKVVHAEARRKDCGICGKVLWSKRAYAIHYRMKHNKTSKVGFRCRICQQRFDTKEQRKLHYTIDHEGESPYHCVDCGKGFASKSGMYGHRQLHTGSGISKCEYCGKEFTRKDSYNEHLLIHNGPRHKCPHCPKEFVQRSNLVRHIRIHTGEKPYQCTFCEKRFSDKGACNSHIRVHTREETCSCPYCGQTFSKKQKLKYHIRKHTGEGLIECEICNKMFTNSFALKEHRVIHNRQTQVVCPQCGKGFNSEKYLQRHVAIVHEPSNAFACPLCPKTFSQQARLKAHVMTHSGVKHMKCLLCDKAYSVRKSLRRHLLEKHQVSPEHPQYKNCFHAMSPEEAGLGLSGTSSKSKTETAPSSSSSGRKRRRVEQIVQSLQHSALSQSEAATATPSPRLTARGSRKKGRVRRRSRRPRTPDSVDLSKPETSDS